jgi:hypothetical protein
VQELKGGHYGGVVSSGDGYEDSPDAEILTYGVNTQAGPGEVAVGRHGNFLQWGFVGSPSQMTEAGRRFFVNCVAYIKNFDGKRPLVQRVSFYRTDAVPQIEALFKKKNIQNATIEQYLEWVYFIRVNDTDVCRVDTELKELGLASNRKVETLKSLVALLKDPQKQNVARKLLGRYTTQDFQQAEEWEKWLQENEGRFFFTDVGGYKFMAAPKGYLPVRD